MAPSKSIRKKLLLAALAFGLAFLAAEVATRVLWPVVEPRPLLYTDNGIQVPLGEFIAYFPKMTQQDFSGENLRRQPPYGLLLGNLKLRMGYWPRPRWDYFDENGCVPVDTNSLGLRDEEFGLDKQPGELRILAIGDSMTYGMGVRLDLTWPQVLEARLRAEREGPVEVINAGFAAGGSSPADYHRWVKDNGIHFEPDVVVVGLCLNDVDPRIGMLTYPAIEVKPVLGGWSLLVDRVVHTVRQVRARSARRDFRKAITDETESWVGTRAGLVAMRDVLEPAGIPLVVVVLPMLSQLEAELYPCRGVHELVVDFCREQRIRCVDLLDRFLAWPGDEQELWAHPSDQHANHVGHAIQAEAIHAYLAREGLL